MNYIMLAALTAVMIWAFRLKKENIALRQIRDQIINRQKIYNSSFLPLTPSPVTVKEE
jgi:hypothetical protein